MGIEELAAIILGDQTQKAIADENPYYRGRGVADTLGKTAIDIVASDPTRYGAKEGAIAGAITGLLSGVFGGLGDNYQNTLTDRYKQMALTGESEGYLPGSLFRKAEGQNQLFNVLANKEEQQLRQARELKAMEEEKALNSKILTHALENPDTAQEDLQSPIVRKLLGMEGIVQEKDTSIASPGAPKEEIPLAEDPEVDPRSEFIKFADETGKKPLAERKDERLMELRRKMRMPRGQAAETANREFQPTMEAAKKARTELEKEGLKLDELNSLYALSEEALAGAGSTGGIGGKLPGLQQFGKILAGQVGLSSRYGEEAAAAANLDNLKSQFLGLIRTLPGAVSDYDAQQLEKAVIGPQKTKEQNAAVIDFMRRKTEQTREYMKAKEEWLTRYGDSEGFLGSWESYRDKKYGKGKIATKIPSIPKETAQSLSTLKSKNMSKEEAYKLFMGSK